MANLSDLTIVIATLPKHYPSDWIKQIRSYVESGVQVIIVLPLGYTSKNIQYDLCNISGVRICVADTKGQVTQRIYGFRKADTIFVMQMDDDIYLDVNTLERFIETFKMLDENSVMAPRLLAKEVYKDLQCNPDWRSFRGLYRQISARLIHGLPWLHSSNGCITPSGYGYTYPSHLAFNSPVPAEWLPGGCVIHRHKNLILEPFYPFNGKAYVEDLIHSFYLRKRGLKMFYNLSISAYTPAPNTIGLDIDPSELFLDFRARLYYVELIRGSVKRMRITYIFKAIKLSIFLMLSILKN